MYDFHLSTTINNVTGEPIFLFHSSSRNYFARELVIIYELSCQVRVYAIPYIAHMLIVGMLYISSQMGYM